MYVIDSNTALKDRAFYFPGKLENRLDAKIWQFRSEEEYDAQEQPDILSMNLVHDVIKCVEKPPALVLCSDPSPPSQLRSKKGVLWGHTELRQLPHVAFEVDCTTGNTRLGAVVDLRRFSFCSSADAVLNWVRGLLLLAEHGLSDARQLAEQWVSKDASSVLGFDYDAIALSLQRNPQSAILRYLPPGNCRTEAIAVIADRYFVDNTMRQCIDLVT
jgi:hypothetical protein